VQELAQSFGEHPWEWLMIVALGVYHGANPGMGWLFAVSNGMQSRCSRAVLLALPPIALGHFLAMAVALLPFAILGFYLERLSDIRAAAGLILMMFGIYRLLRQRHPRFLARVGPSHLTAWSFLLATAHGAGLMLVPVVLGLSGQAQGGAHGGHHAHRALVDLANGSLGVTFAVSAIHTIMMVQTGGVIAWLVYRYVGVGLLRRAWFNLDLLWAVLLIVVGAVALAAALSDVPLERS
jgi:hypothetical protein